ncbi:MAG: cobyric acid synthase, partial [Nitrospirae bacterium]|nr:cobyric acid synthase [Nitrospirota bacterium]
MRRKINIPCPTRTYTVYRTVMEMNNFKTQSLMIQGTGSGVGKSLIVAGLCRILSDMKIRVAPFKAQNMALNSFVTKDGGEIGRAQALQAEAARVEPSVYMNPVLLKASGEKGAQVVLNGRVHSNMTAKDYYEFRHTAWPVVTEAWQRLAEEFDIILIEGAGSPAEINLMDKEIVNMAVARYTGSPVVLVGDIDRGGVFASLYGTVALLDGDASRIRAFIINRFRGDISILEPGNRLITEKTGIPVIGVIPYIRDLVLNEEDGLSLNNRTTDYSRPLKITILRTPFISNFTDFDPFLFEPDVQLLFSLRKEDILQSDLVIVPGSKNTIKDLVYLKERGIDILLRERAKTDGYIIGICGGYQMLGKRIKDPFGVESEYKSMDAIGLLDVETDLKESKTTSQVTASLDRSIPLINNTYENLKGYEIHMGESLTDNPLFTIKRTAGNKTVRDGSAKGPVWGTYIHGIFDNDRLRRDMLNSLRERKGLPPVESVVRY